MTAVLASAGIVGTGVFIGDWAVLGANAARYSPTQDAISRLAALHTPTRPAMTAGFVVYGAGLSVYSFALHRSLEGRAWVMALATGVATFGVAAFPLGTKVSGDVHAVFAGIGYATLAATPLLAARALHRRGARRDARRGEESAAGTGPDRGGATPVRAPILWAGKERSAAVASAIIGSGCALCLAATTFAPRHGLFQRAGLTLGDLWVMATALSMAGEAVRGRSAPSTPGR